MSSTKPEQGITFHLYRLPKNKAVLDFVLSKLADGASPEKFELIASILEMYRTSAGFDPFAMSKGRFRRIKAKDFKTVLTEIDSAIAQVIRSEDYQRVLARHTGFEPLFQEFLELDKSVTTHAPSLVRSEAEAFENHCEAGDAVELLMAFYRLHASFYETLNQREELESFKKHYDKIAERTRQLQRQFRLSLDLLSLELAAESGSIDQWQVEAVHTGFEELLTLEQQENLRLEILVKIIRAGILSPAPGRHISNYTSHIEANLEKLKTFQPDSSRALLRILAQYHLEAGKKQRMDWLDEAEKVARREELHDERPVLRFVQSMIEADEGDIDASLRCLNEVEHLIFKASSRSIASRNNWLKLSEMRTLLYTLKALQGDLTVIANLEPQRRMAEEMGRHRQEIAVMLLEWRGLEHFLEHSFDKASECFSKALAYRKKQGDQPWLMIDGFFTAVLGKGQKKEASAEFALLLQEMKEPFYSATGVQIMKLAPALIPVEKPGE